MECDFDSTEFLRFPQVQSLLAELMRLRIENVFLHAEVAEIKTKLVHAKRMYEIERAGFFEKRRILKGWKS